MQSPAPSSASSSSSTSADTALAWADCPRCGEHWPAGAPYCGNCGWSPEAGRGQPDRSLGQEAAATRYGRLATQWAVAALAGLLCLLLWAWARERDKAPSPATVTPAPLARSVDRTSAPSPASASASASASAAASGPASVATTVEPAPAQVEPAALAGPEQFVRDWLAAEAGTEGLPDTLRPYYAEQVAYRGLPAATWSQIAADKARFVQRWPKRQYELLALQPLDDGADGQLSLALRVRWRLESQGRWQRGESVTLLTLRRIDARWRIVSEQPAPARSGGPSSARPASSVTVAPER